MTNYTTDIPKRKAARIAGFGLLTMFFLGPLAILFILSNLIVPGDAATTVNNVKANVLLFGIGIAIYLIILDVVVALTLYIVLKPVNKNLSLLVAVSRLAYAAIMVISLLALVLLFVDAYSYGMLIAYIFFIFHLLILGFLVYKSGYIPRSLGVLLIIASFCYLILNYGEFLLPKELYDALFMTAMLPATFAEISLGLWLLLKANKLPEINDMIDS
jgi:hypothetical protein